MEKQFQTLPGLAFSTSRRRGQGWGGGFLENDCSWKHTTTSEESSCFLGYQAVFLM